MTFRSLTTLAVAVGCAALPAAAQTLAANSAKSAPAKKWTLPRMPDGKPNLQGIWSNASSVPLERPKELGAKEFYTEEEMEALAKRGGRQGDAVNVGEVHYDMSQYGLDRASAKIPANRRTSLIIGPEGHVPPMIPEAAERNAKIAAAARGHEWDGAENRGLSERCILWGNEGPPMLPQGYNSNLQITQGPGYVAIMIEMIHDVRIIPTDGRAPLPANVKQWFGSSRGHWEGDTLVVETTNFTDRTRFRGSTDTLKVTERFSRVSENSILYRFTVEDPKTWAKPWSAEYPMLRGEGPLFEYACHEGNYGMPNILSGKRAEERAAAEAAQKK